MTIENIAPDRAWPADAVERMETSSLVPYARNARLHSEAQIAEIAASMLEWGFTIPVLVDENREIIAGHGRLLAAASLGWATVPVMSARGWTDAQKKAYRIADNKIALNAAWDIQMLAAELADLPGMETLVGFSEADLLALAGGSDDAPPDVEEARRTLAERFGIAPFSVLNAREGWWQERKRAWLALGIESEVGRGENLIGRSIFDRLSIILPGTYSDTKAFVESRRAAGMSDNDIETEAHKLAGTSGASGSQRLAAGGGSLVDRMADGEGTKRKKNGKSAARAFGQDLMRGEHVVGKGKAVAARVETGAIVAGKGWAEGGPARRDPAFYTKKRAWEKTNNRKITTTEFREKYWDGAA